MSHISIIEDLPKDLQLPMIKVLDAFERDMSNKLAVRRQDFDELKETIGELAEAQKRTEMRIAELTEAQKRTETRIAELTEAQKRTEMRVAELTEAQKRTEMRVAEFVEYTREAIRLLTNKQAKLIGAELERKYRNKAHAYLGTIMRRARPVPWLEIEDALDAHLSNAEINELSLLDLMVRGRLKGQPDSPEVWLAIEVSFVVDRKDVERAQRRAALLRKAGYRAIPTAAGEEVTLGGKDAAREGNVFLLQNGRKQFWEEALAEALAG